MRFRLKLVLELAIDLNKITLLLLITVVNYFFNKKGCLFIFDYLITLNIILLIIFLISFQYKISFKKNLNVFIKNSIKPNIIQNKNLFAKISY